MNSLLISIIKLRILLATSLHLVGVDKLIFNSHHSRLRYNNRCHHSFSKDLPTCTLLRVTRTCLMRLWARYLPWRRPVIRVNKGNFFHQVLSHRRRFSKCSQHNPRIHSHNRHRCLIISRPPCHGNIKLAVNSRSLTSIASISALPKRQKISSTGWLSTRRPQHLTCSFGFPLLFSAGLAIERTGHRPFGVREPSP